MFIYPDINLLSRYFLNKNVLNKYKPYLSKCSNLYFSDNPMKKNRFN